MLYATMNNKIGMPCAVIVHRLFAAHMSPLLSGSFIFVSVRIIWCKSTLGMRQFLFFGLSDRECLA